jgi:hypothetical protein
MAKKMMKVKVNSRALPRRGTLGRLKLGDEFRIKGRQGLFRFRGVAVNAEGEDQWVDYYGPLGDHQKCGACFPDEVVQPSAYSINRQRRTKEAA